VPWVPQPSTFCSSKSYDDSEDTIELMEADEMGEEQEAMMDVEQEDNSSSTYCNYPTMLNLHHQPEGGFQQHCFLPLIPQNTSTPITWTR